jgi:hypothetical protein
VLGKRLFDHLRRISAIILLLAPFASPQDTSRVWVNTRSGVYHCPGGRHYGKTASGIYVSEPDAIKQGYRPAYGKSCGKAAASVQQPQFNDEATPNECGFARWPVKVFADLDSASVSTVVVDTTIRALSTKPRPHRFPYNRRIAPEEFTTYRVRAKLVRVKDERDSDLHLLLADPEDSSARMIAEIPHPGCAVATGHQQEYGTARRQVRHIAPGSLIEVTGLAFFDYMHDQTGAAPNGIELHPVLSVRAIQSAAK